MRVTRLETKSTDVCVALSDLFLKHRSPNAHPECPERLFPLMAEFQRQPWLAGLSRISGRGATRDELYRVHAREMVERVLVTRGKEGWLDADTYFSPKSADVALSAVGHAIDMSLAIWSGRFRRGFSFSRPPGHHATREEAMGFCLFNNVALAAAAILNEAPQARLAIVDFDLHHGNGSQFSFYEDPRVLFVSSHRYPFYPGSGKLEETGKGKGLGTTLNLPLSQAVGDDVVLPLYARAVVPALKSFAPDMILVSAGFDGHARDPMGGLRLSTESYGDLARRLIACAEASCQGKIAFFLEGGYHPDSLRDSAIEVLKAMEEAPREKSDLPPPCGDNEIIESLVKFHRATFPEIA